MQMAADRPEEALALLEDRQFLAREGTLLRKLVGGIRGMQILGDPEQGIQVAKATLAILHVRFDKITALAHLQVTHVAFTELVGDELLGSLRYDLVTKIRNEPIEEPTVSANVARLKDGGQNRVVGTRQPDALVNAASCVSNLLPRIPEAIENELHDGLHPRRLPRRQDEQQVDIRTRSECSTAISTHGNDRNSLLSARRRKKTHTGQFEQTTDQLVLGFAQRLGTSRPFPISDQPAFSFRVS